MRIWATSWSQNVLVWNIEPLDTCHESLGDNVILEKACEEFSRKVFGGSNATLTSVF